MIFGWLKRWRRKKIMAVPFPPAWLEYLHRNVRHYAYLPPAQQTLLRKVVQVFVAEKHFAGAAGAAITDEIKVTVAAQASLLVLGLEEPYFFDRVPSIILYPRNFARPHQVYEGSWIIHENVQLAGEAWYRGPIVLAWEEVLACGRGAARGRNVTVHEFAHHLDGLDGEVDGVPPLAANQQQRWYRVTEAEYLRLVGSAQRQEATLLDQYGATNRVEFFAVATECFFEQPYEMQRSHDELYAILRDFYRQDPAVWLPREDPAFAEAAGYRKRPTAAGVSGGTIKAGPDDDGENEPSSGYLDMLAQKDPEKLFLLGMEYLKEGSNRSADKVFSKILEGDPSDAEVYPYRAAARLRLGRHAAAVADAEESLRLEPGSAEALRVRGAARLGLGDLQGAKADLDQVLANDRNDAEAFYLRGLTWLGLDNQRRAVSDLSWSITLRPLDAKGYYHRAHAYRRLGYTEKADADLEKALQLDPHVGWRQ